MCVLFKVLFLCSGFLLWPALITQAQVEVKFIENKNQWAQDVHFASRIPGGRMFVGPGSFKYFFVDYDKFETLHHQSHQAQPDGMEVDDRIRGHAVFVDFPGSDLSVKPQAFGRSDEYYNYFIGSDPHRWASKAYAYQGMLYQSFYPGVDLKIYSAGENVKYDFVVAPNGDPSVIRLHYQGADKIFLDNGNLNIKTPLADIIEKDPVAWQVINGEKAEVKCEFRLDKDLVFFLFPDGFDSCYELVIDPLLIFSTFSGSSADNWGSTATPGEHGKLYSAGVTNEGEGGVFPATGGAFQTASGGLYDIGILKYDSLGSDLLYATYLGGSQADSPHSLIMNAAGELILLGSTSSSNFATTSGAFDRTFNEGPAIPWVVGYTYSAGSDIVISRFSGDGTQLLASTFIGGTNNDGLNPQNGELSKNYGDQVRGDIITDDEGNVYVSSVTSSADFPVANSISTTYGGGASDAILFKMDPNLSQVLWGTFIGGTGTDAAHTLKFDSLNNIFLAGGTTSANFPITNGAYQPVYAGQVDGWIAKVASDGSAILHSTYTGTGAYNQIYFIDLNTYEEVYVYGQTSGDFPVSPGVYSNPGSGQFIQKFTHSLNARLFSTVFGSGRGFPDISPTAFLVNDCNNLYMAGWGGEINSQLGFWQSNTHGMTTTPDAFQLTTSGSDFYFIVLTEDAKERLYATFLGGNQSRTHVDGGTSRFDKGGIVYHSVCSGCKAFNPAEEATSDFPTTTGAWSRTNKSINCNNAAFKFDLSSLKAQLQTNSAKRDMPGLKVVCIPDAIVFENVSIGGEIFEWDLGDGTKISKTDTANISHQYQDPGQYKVKLTAIDRGTCRAVDSTFTIVTVNIAQSAVQDDADVCFGDSFELQASGGISYTWTSADPNFISGDPTPIVTPEDTTTYYIRLEEANGCIRRDTVQLNVIPGIHPDFEWNKLPDCLGRPEIAVRNLTDSVDARDMMFFDFGDGTTADHLEGEHYFEKDGVYNIRLVTQREFCVYEKAVSIPVFEMLIPNVITPGQPEHNDVFTIRYGKAEGVTPADYGFNVSLTIYNRWGRIIYQTDHYQYDWSGEDLAAGIYYYEVTVEGHATCKSWLHLVK
ncbi:MAG: PKD domain-containing protein [Cyclobacteriaceae bacterium]